MKQRRDRGGDGITKDAVFTVSLSQALGQPASVTYATAGGSAASGTDYTPVSGNLNFAAGVLTQTITVPILGDVVQELDEAFRQPGQQRERRDRTRAGVGTILDDEPTDPLDYFSLTPCRLLDTRLAGQGPVLASGASRIVTVAGTCGVPATARAIAANVTAVASTGAGNLKLYRGDGTPPTASALNFGAGRTRANNGVFAMAGNGTGTLAILPTVAGAGTIARNPRRGRLLRVTPPEGEIG